MKKIVAMVLSVIMLLFVCVACQSTSENTGLDQEANSNSDVITDSKYAVSYTI